MSEHKSDRRRIAVTYVRTLPASWLVEPAHITIGEKVTLPFSQCEMEEEDPSPGDTVHVWVPKWLLERHSLE
jgi:hypothetical protein